MRRSLLKATLVLAAATLATCLCATPVHAQQCTAGGGPRITILASTGTARGNGDFQAATLGSAIEWENGRVGIRGGYARHYTRSDGADLDVASIGAAVRLPRGICVSVDPHLAAGAGLPDGSHYRTLNLPLSVGSEFAFHRGRHSQARLYGAVQALFAFTDARLFGFDVAGNDIGVGATIGVRTHIGPIVIDFAGRHNTLGEQHGPQPLGGAGVMLRVGFMR